MNKELAEITAAFDLATAAGKRTALATVVKVDGSAYRREGARMLIDERGQLTGAISGGCLEGDALRKALHVITRQKPMLVTYDSTDGEHEIGLQLGCNGVVHILIEPIDNQLVTHPILFFKQLFERRENAVLATFFSFEKRGNEQPGTRFLFFENGKMAGETTNFSLPEQLDLAVKKVFSEKKSAFQNVDFEEKNWTVFLEFLPPPPSLVIFGAGNDVRPLVCFSKILGWQTTVIDGRPQLARPERFPEANRVFVAKPEAALDQIMADERTFFLLMTHNYNYDLAVLRGLFSQKTKYIGLLGPRKKFDRMLDDLHAQNIPARPAGGDFQEDSLKNIFSPIGLDLGGDSPESIALAIVSEIQAVISGRGGGFLRERNEPIH